MTAPDKIWATVGYIGKHDTRVRGEFDSEPSEKAIPYVPLALAQAAIAAAYEAAARVVDPSSPAESCTCQACNERKWCAQSIRALATPDQIAALAAKVDASQAPNPAVNGGSSQSATIPLPRAEVEALMEAAQLVSDWDEWALQIGGVCPDRLVGCLGKMRLSLATLQERMK